MSLAERVGKIVVSEYELKRIVPKLANQVRKDYETLISVDNPLVLVIILRGAFVFAADLIRELNDLPLEIDFMTISSYNTGETESSRVVQILQDLRINIQDRHALIIEDIVDTGWSLEYLTRYLKEKLPASLKTCVLLNKPERREIEVTIDYVGVDIPNQYVIGGGLDGSIDGFHQLFRNLRDIAVLKTV